MVNSRWHYRAYDLHFVCDFELPELAPWGGDETATPDVSIQLGAPLTPAELERAVEQSGALEWGDPSEGEPVRLSFGLARFTVRGGSHILVEPVEGYGASSWRVPLLGSVLAALLQARGLLVLHAGALSFGGGAAAFLGDKGQGKSTLNAALAEAGFPLLSDDVVALQMPAPSGTPLNAGALSRAGASSDTPLALSGFGQIKLSPASLRAVTGEASEAWPAVAPELGAALDKRSFRATLSPGAAPLRALFVLHSAPVADSAGAGLTLRRLSAQGALAQLIPHTFGARFGADYLRGPRGKAHFLGCARVVNSCTIWELQRPRDLALLPQTVALIAREMERIGIERAAQATEDTEDTQRSTERGTEGN